MEPSPTDRPAFELETYADLSLPYGKQLFDETDLVGHTIRAVETVPQGEYAESTDMIIVTDTMCWLVLTTSEVYGCDETASVVVESEKWSYRAPDAGERTLYDYLGATRMFGLGLCTDAEYQHLVAKEQAAKKERAAKRAKQLREEAAKLEGGAT